MLYSRFCVVTVNDALVILQPALRAFFQVLKQMLGRPSVATALPSEVQRAVLQFLVAESAEGACSYYSILAQVRKPGTPGCTIFDPRLKKCLIHCL